MNIPEEAIEAARKSVRVKIIGTPSDQMLEEIAIRGVEAAAQIIAAQTLKDAARAYSGNPDGLTSNGHVRWFLEDMATELDPA